MATAKSAAAKFVGKMNDRAERLSVVRALINDRDEEYKRQTEALFTEEKELKEGLLEDLKTLGLSSVKVSSGDAYVISHKKDFIINDPIAANSWAKQNNCARVDKRILDTRLGEMLKKGDELPAFVEVSERETISIRKAKEDSMAQESS